MAESNFSWKKVASFIGALILIVLAFAFLAAGIYQIDGGSSFHGVASIIGGVVCGIGAWLVYRNYQKPLKQ